MKIRLVIPDVNEYPADRPDACRYCGYWRLHRHGQVTKPVTDHRVAEVVVERYKCLGCGRTFRQYPHGVTAQDQSQRTVVLAALLYGLGLSCSASTIVLSAFGPSLGRMSVWRAAQTVGAGLRRSRPAGRVRVLGVDETVFRVRGEDVVVGFVVDGQQERTLGFEVLYAGDAAAFVAWLQPYAAALGAEVVVSDGHDAYGVVTTELGLAHQLCLAHVRKALTRRVRAINAQATAEWDDPAQLERDLATVRALVTELPADGDRPALVPASAVSRPCASPTRRAGLGRLSAADAHPGVSRAVAQTVSGADAAGAGAGRDQQCRRTRHREEQSAL